MTMPQQKPGKSEQTVGTPIEFLRAVAKVFGAPTWDLAALTTNKVASSYFGPDHADPTCRDSLVRKWRDLPSPTLAWLNPPYASIAPWAAKSVGAVEANHSLSILMLVPASVGANWWTDHVVPFADVYSVGRMKFVGHTDPYPKDLALCHYWALGGHKFRRWRWDK